MVMCYVVGCDSGSAKDKPSHLFKISKNATEEVRRKWIKNIPKLKGKDFDFESCKICDRHFEDRFIEKQFFTYLDNRPIAGIERNRWRLTADAVPTKFSNAKVSPFYDCKLTERKPPKVRAPLNDKKPIKVKSHVGLPTEEKENEENALPDNFMSITDIHTITNHSFTGNELRRIDLPTGWVFLESGANFKFSKILQEKSDINIINFLVERCVTVCSDGSVVLQIRNKILNDVITSPITNTDQIRDAVSIVNKLVICAGVQLYNGVNSCEAAFKFNNRWISNECEILQTNEVPICVSCCMLHKMLERKTARIVKKKSEKAVLHQAKQSLIACKKTISRHRGRIQKLSTSLKDLRKQFLLFNQSRFEAYLKNDSNLSEPFQSALATALKVAKAKSKYAVRYEYDWMLQALLLKINSPKCYRYMRDNKLLPLPHPNYITSILKGIPCQYGFSDFVFQELKTYYGGKDRLHRQFVVLFDEMKIKETVSFDKSHMKFTGFIDYGELMGEYKPTTSSKIADHALVIMCRCLNSNMTQPLATFATRGAAPGNMLAKILVSTILKLENVGCEVIGVTCDGSTTNKSCWKYLGITGRFNSPIINKITNPADDSRVIFFFSDMPHIIKCIRNNLHKKVVAMFKKMQVNWGFFRALYDLDQVGDIRAVPKLTSIHLDPNPWNKMVVSYAVQMFSKSIADALKFYREGLQNDLLKHSEGTEYFCRSMNNLFDATNARIPSEGVKPGDRSFLTIKEFLESLEKDDTFASPVTLESLRVTLASMLESIEYLCNEVGFHYVLTAKYNQDCLENFFGLCRSFGGDDTHPSALSFSQIFRLLSIYSPTLRIMKGNSKAELNTSSVVSYVDTLKKLSKNAKDAQKRRMADMEDKLLSSFCYELDSGKTVEDKENCAPVTAENCKLYHFCGYIAFKIKKTVSCEGCKETLCDKSPDKKLKLLTEIKDFGGLNYPSEALFNFISQIIEPKIVLVLSNNLQMNFMEEFLSKLNFFNCAGLGCCEDHSYTLVVKIVTFYITVRMYFHSKIQTKDVMRSSRQRKEKMKQAKLV